MQEISKFKTEKTNAGNLKKINNHQKSKIFSQKQTTIIPTVA